MSDCVIWPRAKDRKGYGAVYLDGKMRKAHRVAWEKHHGQTVPDGLMVMHHCDNPPCVNPDHLFTGTAADNTADMMAKGRHRIGVRLHGEDNPAAKITQDGVREIRALRSQGLSLRKIAAQFGIVNAQVGNIARGKHWGWVK
jgi:HNH endonuclease